MKLTDDEKQAISADLTGKPLWYLARFIRRHWGKNMHFGAVPYLEAMHQLNEIGDYYGADRGIVLYLLSNMSGWRGDVAKIARAQLKQRIGVK